VGLPPLRNDPIDVQRAKARRRSLHHSRVDLGDLNVERDDPTTDSRFVVELFDRVASTSSTLRSSSSDGDNTVICSRWTS
jgi:hypothetical protein